MKSPGSQTGRQHLAQLKDQLDRVSAVFDPAVDESNLENNEACIPRNSLKQIETLKKPS